MLELRVPVVPNTRRISQTNDSERTVQEGAITIIQEEAHLEVFTAFTTCKKKVDILPVRAIKTL